MKLLIVTQIVDTEDPALGFFCGWLDEFARQYDELTVICLKRGAYTLPSNVRVFSLGKEVRASRISYLRRFFYLITAHRTEYDAVLVHMNPEYAVLGGPLWRLWGKYATLWYTHKAVNRKLRLAERIVHAVYTASPESFRLPHRKTVVVGHGIDTTRFVPRPHAHTDLVIGTVSRITRSKNIAAIIDLAAEAKGTRPDVVLRIAGAGVTDEDVRYEREMRQYAVEKGFNAREVFVGARRHAEVPEFLSSIDRFINISDTGSLDKAILEAMACGVPVLTTNDAGRALVARCVPELACRDLSEMRAVLLESLSWSEETGADIGHRSREYVTTHMSLPTLVRSIAAHMKSNVGHGLAA